MRRWQPSSVTSPEIDVTLRRPITHRQYDTGGGGVPAPAPRRDLCAAPQSESAPAAPRAWTGLLRDDVHTLNYTAVRPLDSLTLLHVCSLICVCVCGTATERLVATHWRALCCSQVSTEAHGEDDAPRAAVQSSTYLRYVSICVLFVCLLCRYKSMYCSSGTNVVDADVIRSMGCRALCVG